MGGIEPFEGQVVVDARQTRRSDLHMPKRSVAISGPYAGVMLLIGLSGACASSMTSPFGDIKENSVQACLRKSCVGPKEARDYERCEATCRERFGQ